MISGVILTDFPTILKPVQCAKTGCRRHSVMGLRHFHYSLVLVHSQHPSSASARPSFCLRVCSLLSTKDWLKSRLMPCSRESGRIRDLQWSGRLLRQVPHSYRNADRRVFKHPVPPHRQQRLPAPLRRGLGFAALRGAGAALGHAGNRTSPASPSARPTT